MTVTLTILLCVLTALATIIVVDGIQRRSRRRDREIVRRIIRYLDALPPATHWVGQYDPDIFSSRMLGQVTGRVAEHDAALIERDPDMAHLLIDMAERLRDVRQILSDEGIEPAGTDALLARFADLDAKAGGQT